MPRYHCKIKGLGKNLSPFVFAGRTIPPAIPHIFVSFRNLSVWFLRFSSVKSKCQEGLRDGLSLLCCGERCGEQDGTGASRRVEKLIETKRPIEGVTPHRPRASCQKAPENARTTL